MGPYITLVAYQSEITFTYARGYRFSYFCPKVVFYGFSKNLFADMLGERRRHDDDAGTGLMRLKIQENLRAEFEPLCCGKVPEFPQVSLSNSD